MSRSIPLQGGGQAIVDAADYAALSQYTWFKLSDYAYRAGNGKLIAMHREIMPLPDGDDRHVDHINRNGLDNRRQNLRLATHQQNSWNCGVSAANSSGYKGVFPEKKTGRWRACIRVSGRREYLGTYATKEEAARAYDGAARHYFGEFAFLNFPNESNHYAPIQQSSCYRGVSRRKNRWEACLKVDKVRVFRGIFDTEDEAARAYDAAAREHLGNGARLNFPDEAVTPARVWKAAA